MANKNTGMNVGGSSILVIFVLLCLTTFATLSMVSANADYKLTKKSQVSIAGFYVADSLAEEKLAEIDSSLKQGYISVNSGGAIDVSGVLAGQEGLEIASGQTGESTINYVVNISESQELFVSLTTSPEIAKSGVFYKINAWQVRAIISEQDGAGTMFGEEELNLFAG